MLALTVTVTAHAIQQSADHRDDDQIAQWHRQFAAVTPTP
jgi:hypothetical protein